MTTITATHTDLALRRVGTAEDSGKTFAANAGRNANREPGRRWHWRPARDALWSLLDERVTAGAQVAVVGAGNGDDVPLRRLARRAGRVDLIDLDHDALAYARRRVRHRRSRVCIHSQDVTGGAADAIVARALGETASLTAPPTTPIGPGAPYDVVVADLMFTQLLYPALQDAGLSGTEMDAALRADGQALANAVAARLHASVPNGLVIYVHDLLGWWPGHPQPFALDEVLELAQHHSEAALALAASGAQPRGCDPRLAAWRAGAEVIQTDFWRWPFAPDTDYLVCATVVRTSPTAARRPEWTERRVLR